MTLKCDFDLRFSRLNFEIDISRMGGPHMEQKGCESIGCLTHYVTLNYQLIHDLGQISK